MFIDSRQNSLSPGLATNLWANSFWNISTAHLKKGLCSNNLNTRGELIWYGIFATQISKNGSSVFRTSPTRICSLAWYGVPWTRFCNSATNLKIKLWFSHNIFGHGLDGHRTGPTKLLTEYQFHKQWLSWLCLTF